MENSNQNNPNYSNDLNNFNNPDSLGNPNSVDGTDSTNSSNKKRGFNFVALVSVILSLLITIGASVYQRMTGPTHPARTTTTIDGKVYDFKFSRSGGEENQLVVLKGLSGNGISANLCYRRYPTDDNFTVVAMEPTNEGLIATLPVQPPAGKLEYYIQILVSRSSSVEESREEKFLFKDDPLIIRFKGNVSAGVLIPHILLMFISMLFASMAMIYAIINRASYKTYLLISVILLFVGGFIFGPLVQKQAFGVYWSGFPFGMDLTDNKTLLAMIALLAALFTSKYKWNRIATVIAVIVMYIVFSIPHSMRGSELDHQTGKIETSAE